MKKTLVILVLLVFGLGAHGEIFTGGVEKSGIGNSSVILDAQTNLPVENVKITVPNENFTTYTDANGAFILSAKLNSPSILSVEKDGYRPYSLTVDKSMKNNPIIVSIEKSSADDVIVTQGWYHLGDNSFSLNSANSKEFHKNATGSYYSENFKISANSSVKKYVLIIGSIIGIDSLMAQKMGQNAIKSSYSSPPEIYFNGIKIASIELNGDSQRFELPKNLIRRGMDNEIMIKTGKNLSSDKIDYDDIEFMNLSVVAE